MAICQQRVIAKLEAIIDHTEITNLLNYNDTSLHSYLNKVLSDMGTVAEESNQVSKLKKLILKHINLESKLYANHRESELKNGGITVYIRKRPVAYLYAIVDSKGGVIAVKSQGILKRYFRDGMMDSLIQFLNDVEEKEYSKPRNLYWNYIDSPLD